MNNKLKKKYGLFTAICMVVGIVIGSGIFFKAESMLEKTNGDMLIGVLAWLIGGLVMIVCAVNFANFASRYEKVNGLVDYSEAIVGDRYAYMMGWFATTIYYPAMTSVLAWVSARYTLVLFGQNDPTTGLCMTLGCLYLVLAFFINTLGPKIAGKLQVSSTIIKLIPLIIMAIVGTVVGLVNGNTIEAFRSSSSSGNFESIFGAIVAGAFAYEGWIIATSINAELKDSKKNLPIALIVGSLIVIIIYITYFVGLAGGASIIELEENPLSSYNNIFGSIGSTILMVFIVVSCLGTLNGLMFASIRSTYSVAVRNHGLNPKMMQQVDSVTNMPTNSSIIGLLFTTIWYFYFYGANLNSINIFGIFSFDSSELPIITIYAMYIPLFVIFIFKEGKKDIWRNIVMPILGIIASLFMVFAAIYSHGYLIYKEALNEGRFACPVLFYLIIFGVIMGLGLIFYKKK